MTTPRCWLQFLDDHGQWCFPGDASACAFTTDDEAEDARVSLLATCPEYADVADWRTVESVDPPGNVGSYADEQRAREPRYRLDDEPGAFRLGPFLAENEGALPDDDVDRMRALEPGETMTLGGGAAATFMIRRVA